MNAWLFQDVRQKQKLGDKCPWSVGWYDPEGKRKSKRIGSQSMANKFRQKVEGQLATGVYESNSKKPWADFRAEYEERGQPGTTHGTRQLTVYAIEHFKRIINPVRVRNITSRMFSEYVAVRQSEPSRKNAPAVRPATIHRELRALRAVVRKAHRWGYLSQVPEIDFLKEPGKLATYVTPEHCAKLYQESGAANRPNEGPFEPTEWWQALLVTAYVTGWRIGSLMALRRQDVDLEQGWASSRAADNKGKRDHKGPLHAIVVEDRTPAIFCENHWKLQCRRQDLNLHPVTRTSS